MSSKMCVTNISFNNINITHQKKDYNGNAKLPPFCQNPHTFPIKY